MKNVCLGEGPASLYSAIRMKRLNPKTGYELADHIQTDINIQNAKAGSALRYCNDRDMI